MPWIHGGGSGFLFIRVCFFFEVLGKWQIFKGKVVILTKSYLGYRLYKILAWCLTLEKSPEISIFTRSWKIARMVAEWLPFTFG